VKKSRDAGVLHAFNVAIQHIQKNYSHIRLFRELPLTKGLKIQDGVEIYRPHEIDRPNIDLVVTLGGDGTILHASSLFSTGPVPPVLSFSMGTLGFLLPFHINSLPTALRDVITGKVTILPRMRLTCTFLDVEGRHMSAFDPQIGKPQGPWQVMNEVTLHRGRSPHLTIIDSFVDENHLTEAVADGLIVSTPTGSTAYSLSSGGPIVHPSLRALLLTPICPRSLSFRPLLLPGTSSVRLQISQKSRAPAEVSMDGQAARLLQPGESVQVETSPYPIPCINRSSASYAPDAHSTVDHDHEATDGMRVGQDNWVRDINNLLRFNASFQSSAVEFGKDVEEEE